MLATTASPDLAMLPITKPRPEQSLDKKRTTVIRSFIQDLFITEGPPAALGKYMAYECHPNCSDCFCKRVEFVREEASAFLAAYHASKITVLPYADTQRFSNCAAYAMPSRNEIYGVVGNGLVMMYLLFEVGSDKLVSFSPAEQEKYLFAF